MLIIENLTHVYANGVKALDEVSLTIPGGMYGLLGPNGAGKSTLMRTVATLQAPTSGHIRFGDIDVLKSPDLLRRTLGYLPQDFGVYPRVSAYDMLDHMAVLKGIAGAKDRKDGRREPAQPGQSVGRAQEGHRRLLGRHAPAVRHRPGPDRRSAPDHRRRAHRRPRPRGAQPLPQPAGRDRRERGGDPVDPHRRGRLGPLPGHGDHLRRPHRQGRRAADLVGQLSGRIWRKVIDKAELEAAKAEHQVISTRLLGGRTVIHVLADQDPGAGFTPVEGGLEDVYFSTLSNTRRAA
jgi:ABC-2 type transport system ATP-binding protein